MLIKKVKTVEMSLNFFLRITKLALLFDYKGAPIYKFSSFEIKKIPAEIPGDSLRFPFFPKMAPQNEKNDNKKSLFMCPKSLSEGVFRDLEKKKKKKRNRQVSGAIMGFIPPYVVNYYIGMCIYIKIIGGSNLGPIGYILGAWRPENGPKSGPAPPGGGWAGPPPPPRGSWGLWGGRWGVWEGFGGAFVGVAQLPVNKFTFTQF